MASSRGTRGALTSERERRSAARAVHSLIGELDGSKLPGATPVRRVALRPHVELLERIETRLADGVPVSAGGMLALDELLTSPGSCVFAEVDDPRAELSKVLRKLDVR
ncbi:MAG TPA: hypothetical protein VFA05_01000 [Gaiellaceae bacterium]|nr:hypothetical protein [Gaiellaceae bacterium]